MHHSIVSREEWITARKSLLVREKEVTAAFDRLNEERRKLPWVRIDKEYAFDTPNGTMTLAGLFEERSQLFVYHFMFAPGWKAGCVGCSFFGDHVDGANLHLSHHDVTFVAVSRATLPEIEAYKRRMGWQFNWVSSHRSDFNYDFQVSFREEELAGGKVYYNYETIDATSEELPGTSVFFKDESGTVFHTYSTYARGDERGLGAYMMLDLTPRGRNENGPNFNLMDWVKRHDEYAEDAERKRAHR
jgi:predicted dithiol-disulfide oxidoreductase (DUF899 family)